MHEPIPRLTAVAIFPHFPLVLPQSLSLKQREPNGMPESTLIQAKRKFSISLHLNLLL